MIVVLCTVQYDYKVRLRPLLSSHTMQGPCYFFSFFLLASAYFSTPYTSNWAIQCPQSIILHPGPGYILVQILSIDFFLFSLQSPFFKLPFTPYQGFLLFLHFLVRVSTPFRPWNSWDSMQCHSYIPRPPVDIARARTWGFSPNLTAVRCTS